MAERRMISKKIVDTDAFLDMSASAQNLYFHLNVRADDDGFVGNPLSIMRTVSASKNDLDLLILKKFIISFESGVIVIKHWKINNYLQNDRYKETTYLAEKKQLIQKENKSYSKISELDLLTENQQNCELYPECIQNGFTDKDSIGKDSIVEYSKEKGITVSNTQKEKKVSRDSHVFVTKEEQEKSNKKEEEELNKEKDLIPKGIKSKKKKEFASLETTKKYFNNDEISEITFFENEEVDKLFITFLTNRTSIYNTRQSIKMLVNNLNKFDDQVKLDAIEQSIGGNYRGIFPKPKNNRKNIIYPEYKDTSFKNDGEI